MLENCFPEELKTFHIGQVAEFIPELENEHDYAFYLWLLAKVLADYEQIEDLENPIAEAILLNYEWLKTQFANKYTIPVFPRDRKTTQDGETVECPECHSKEVRSRGEDWHCQNCLRRFRKNPRKKHYKK